MGPRFPSDEEGEKAGEESERKRRSRERRTSSNVVFHTVGSIVLSVCSRGAFASALVRALAAGEGLIRKATFTDSWYTQIEAVSYVNHQMSNHHQSLVSSPTTPPSDTVAASSTDDLSGPVTRPQGRRITRADTIDATPQDGHRASPRLGRTRGSETDRGREDSPACASAQWPLRAAQRCRLRWAASGTHSCG